MPKITYDPEMRTSYHGRRLYHYWKKIKGETNSKEFMEYPGFFKWAMQNGYTIGAKLFRYDDEPFSPTNCYWVSKDANADKKAAPKRDYERERKWNETVNRIRLHYGLEPLEQEGDQQ